MSLVGRKAPVFKASAVINGGEIVNDFTLEDYKGKNYVVLFFYPKDFTFVCPTEITAFSDKINMFKDLNCEVMACSVDSAFSHLAWTKQPRNQGGLGEIKFPILEDLSKEIENLKNSSVP